MNNIPLVSVIIPTYNRASMIQEAIQSAIDQTYPNKQILVVDDGSEDDTALIVKSYPEVEYILQAHAGQAAARNNGLKHAKGIYIASLDSDDVWNADFLEKCVRFLEEQPVDFVFANWNQDTGTGSVRDFFSSYVYLQPHLKNQINSWVTLNYSDLRYIYTRSCPSPSSSCIIRSSSMVRGWNEKINIADDWCMLLEIILSKECKAAFTTEKLWLKHINCNNIFDGRNQIEVDKLMNVLDIQEMLLQHGGALTKKEYKVFQRKYLKNLVRSSKHSLFLHSNLRESIIFIKRALCINPLYATRALLQLSVETGRRHFKKVDK